MNEWASTWAEALAGITGDEIKAGLRYCQRHHEWPPTCAEFIAACRATPKHQQRLSAPRTDPAQGRTECARIMAMIASPRKPGKWWATEIIERHNAGLDVHDTALRMAMECLQGQSGIPQGIQA